MAAQLGAEAERTRRGARAEEEHAALMQKVDQLNLLRESNVMLRCVAVCNVCELAVKA